MFPTGWASFAPSGRRTPALSAPVSYTHLDVYKRQVWKITPNCEQSLDRYEGYPRHYTKETVTVKDAAGAELPVMVYIMAVSYTHLCRRGRSHRAQGL